MDERDVAAQVYRGRGGYYLVLNVGPFESEDLAVQEIDYWIDAEDMIPNRLLH